MTRETRSARMNRNQSSRALDDYIISHRFSTVRMADRIDVLKHGSVIENGTREEFINRQGVFAEIVEGQARSCH